jgi:hypothetical protein
MKRLVSTGTAIVVATFALGSSQALACDWDDCDSCSGYGYGYYGASAPAYYAASTYYAPPGYGYGYAPPLYYPSPGYYAAPAYYAVPPYYAAPPYDELSTPHRAQPPGYGYPNARPYDGPRGYVARPGVDPRGAVTYALGVNRAALTVPSISGGPRAAAIRVPGRVPGQLTGQMPGQRLQQKQPPRPTSAPRAVIAEPNKPQFNNKPLIAVPARQGAYIPVVHYAKPPAVQKAPIASLGSRATSIHVPGQLTGQMPGQMAGKSLQQKQPPRPASTPRAVIAEPNKAQSNTKALIAMPVRQTAKFPAAVMSKAPVARVENRLTIR